jgi:hypothetical protein
MASTFSSILDLSDPLREVYLELLRADPMSLEEMDDHPVLGEVEALKVHVMILFRQGHLERYQDGGAVKFRPAAIRRAPSGLSDDLWDALQ